MRRLIAKGGKIMSEQTFLHNLGDLAEDRVTGLKGIIIGRAEHLFGCARYWLQPQEVKDGKPAEGQWFDEDALVIVEAKKVKANVYRRMTVEPERLPARQPDTMQRNAGGPFDAPASHHRGSTK